MSQYCSALTLLHVLQTTLSIVGVVLFYDTATVSQILNVCVKCFQNFAMLNWCNKLVTVQLIIITKVKYYYTSQHQWLALLHILVELK